MPKTIVIVGNGITGITAARHIRKRSDHRIVVIGSESDHFYSRTALMYIYMGHMSYADTKPYEDWFWKKNRIELIRDTATRIAADSKQLHLKSGRTLDYDDLILATGSRSNFPQWPGMDLKGVQGLYGLDDLELMAQMTRGVGRAVVVGGGLIGIEMVEMLRSRSIDVTFLVRELSYMDYLLPSHESQMINAEILEHEVDLNLGTELGSIDGSEDNSVQSVTTVAGKTVPCEFVGIAVGVHPNTALAELSGIPCRRGILVNEYFETGADSVYAAGDCAEFTDPNIGHRAIEQLWYSGRRHGEFVGCTVAGERRAYDRGIFYNSAKFFNLEYQTYGDVPAAPTPKSDSVVWQHPTERKLVRITYDRESRRVLGFNLLGVRFRQSQCEDWIRSQQTVTNVLATLALANFDPEFTARYEHDVAIAASG